MKPITFAIALLALVSTAAHAQRVYAVRPIEGYSCAKLNATDAQMLNPRGTGIVIREAPSATAPIGTTAAAVVFVRTPAHLVADWTEVLQLTGKPGWIETRNLKPVDPSVRCVPSVMSNGRIGIG